MEKAFHYLLLTFLLLASNLYAADDLHNYGDKISQAAFDAETVSEVEIDVITSALLYFEIHMPSVVVSVPSLLKFVRFVEENKEVWLQNKTTKSVKRTIHFTSKNGKIPGYLTVHFSVVDDWIFLIFPGDLLGKGSFSVYSKRIIYPDFVPAAFGIPRLYEDDDCSDASRAAFLAQLEISKYLENTGDDDVWHNVLKPIAISEKWVLYPLMSELIDDLLLVDRSKAKFNFADRINFVGDILNGIVALHKQGIAHNDVKPDNAFICHDNERYCALLSDLNLANKPRNLLAASALRVSIGTARYIAPEVDFPSFGDGDIDVKNANALKADVYSFGITAYVILRGKYPGFLHSVYASDGERLLLRRALLNLFNKFWRETHHENFNYFYMASIRPDVNARPTSAQLQLAWRYVDAQLKKFDGDDRDLSMDEALEVFGSAPYKILLIDDDEATKLLTKTSKPGTFIVRLEKGIIKARLKLSFVLPVEEQLMANKIVQHIYLDDDVVDATTLHEALSFFKNLRLIEDELSR